MLLAGMRKLKTNRCPEQEKPIRTAQPPDPPNRRSREREWKKLDGDYKDDGATENKDHPSLVFTQLFKIEE